MAFRSTIDVDRSVGELFTFLADARNTPSWYEAVARVDPLTPEPVAVGTRYRFARRLPAGLVDNLVEVSEFEADARFTLTSLEGPTPFTYRYTSSPLGPGSRLQLDGEISGAGLTGPAALLAPLAARLFERGMQANLRTLKRILEHA